MEALLVVVGGARFAIPRGAVHEQIPLGPLTPIATAPAAVCGLTQLRGQLLPVLDLALAGARAGPPRSGAPLVVIDLPGHGRAALWLDEAGEWGSVEAAPLLDLGARAREIRQRAHEPTAATPSSSRP